MDIYNYHFNNIKIEHLSCCVTYMLTVDEKFTLETENAIVCCVVKVGQLLVSKNIYLHLLKQFRNLCEISQLPLVLIFIMI